MLLRCSSWNEAISILFSRLELLRSSVIMVETCSLVQVCICHLLCTSWCSRQWECRNGFGIVPSWGIHVRREADVRTCHLSEFLGLAWDWVVEVCTREMGRLSWVQHEPSAYVNRWGKQGMGSLMWAGLPQRGVQMPVRLARGSALDFASWPLHSAGRAECEDSGTLCRLSEISSLNLLVLFLRWTFIVLPAYICF